MNTKCLVSDLYAFKTSQTAVKKGMWMITILLLLPLLSPLCRIFTIIYLKQTMFLGYILLQLFCIY